MGISPLFAKEVVNKAGMANEKAVTLRSSACKNLC